nr:ATP-dependent DNA helicase [cf. Phormidesmis sp. LEGE 11477]
MARLVARALRVGRSALVQTDSLSAYQGTHRLSYLIAALLWPEPAILALPDRLLELVLQQDIPDLQRRLPVVKPVQTGDRWPEDSFRGLLVTSAEGWLRDRLSGSKMSSPEAFSLEASGSKPSSAAFSAKTTGRFPDGIPTIIDGASDLEKWIRTELSTTLPPQAWESLMLAYPADRERILDLRVRLTHTILQHPANPYSCHLIDVPERTLLNELRELLMAYGVMAYGEGAQMPTAWRAFWQQLDQPGQLAWAQMNRELGSFALCCCPTDIDCTLVPVWQRQPVVLVGAALDMDAQAVRYRDRLGLGDMTCLRFGPDRHNDLIQLYLPDRLPMPNTSHFKAAALEEIRRLLGAKQMMDESPQADPLNAGPTVIIVGDVPLRAQFASVLAAEFGSRVQVESGVDSRQGVLITGWEYWRSHQSQFTTPSLMIITTLPIPSLENPLVAGRVAMYKRRQQDWFKAYLLPEALSMLQHAIAPVRSLNSTKINSTKNRSHHRPENHHLDDSPNSYSSSGYSLGSAFSEHNFPDSPVSGVVAILDNRINHRSYGRQLLAALSPAARSSYLDVGWFAPYADRC